ncbi:MAG: succinate dehydrogenase, cytochrome b556 subunit [Mariprofundaceae bacterium]|nr:succinate dehydrogenase, cytochrome b556 subunit [Mariprofundaceae bacterium]
MLKSPPHAPHLSIYRWHPAMIASIAHRASGLVLSLFLPLYLLLLYDMHFSPQHFEAGLALLQKPYISIILWMMGTALLYHFSNGIRFILQDMTLLQSRHALRFSAKLVLAIACVGSLLLGGYLW